MAVPLAERFFDHVDTSGGPDACHPWTGETNDNGYGRVAPDRGGDSRSPLLTHRVAWMLHHGEMPPSSVVIRHVVCNNPPCCNWRHLADGRQFDNVHDAVGASRHAHGATQGHTHLTDQDVLNIRAGLAAGALQADIAAAYGIAQASVSRIKHRKTWTHLPNEQRTPSLV